MLAHLLHILKQTISAAALPGRINTPCPRSGMIGTTRLPCLAGALLAARIEAVESLPAMGAVALRREDGSHLMMYPTRARLAGRSGWL
jgi:hypothetical protein